MRVLAISGSLRASSSNTALLEAVATLAPASVEVILYEGLSALPHFNPDMDGKDVHLAVQDLRNQLRESDGILISSPEYAHGVPGSLKNALDWVVSSGELFNKPVALLNASSRAIHAQVSLLEILATMGAKLDVAAVSNITLPAQWITASDITEQTTSAAQLQTALRLFVAAISA